MDLYEFLEFSVAGNTMKQYLIAFVTFVVMTAGLAIFGKVLIHKLKKAAEKTAGKIDDFAVQVFSETIFPLFYLGAFYFSANQLSLGPGERMVRVFAVVVLTWQGARFFLRLATYVFNRGFSTKTTAENTASKGVLTILRVAIWGIAVVFLLDNFGLNVSAIVAGLGIGGIAVALACQTILGDLFNYFVIFFDKPFKEGDFIVSGDFMGTIEDIGIKSTRIRSLSGEEIIVSNSNLTSSRIHNFKRMQQRRVEFAFRVSHSAPREKIEKAAVEIGSMVKKFKEVTFDRCHMKDFNEYGLVMELVYIVLTADYNKYMDVQQNINFNILDILDKEGIEIAEPALKLGRGGVTKTS